MGSRVLGLRKPWAGHCYHATHSSFSREVSVLIHKSLTYELLDVKVDPEGRYALLHVVIDTIEIIIPGLYMPPLASTALLKLLIPLLSMYSTDNLIFAGDFNMVPNPSMDRLSQGAGVDSPLSKWVSLYGLTDVWR